MLDAVVLHLADWRGIAEQDLVYAPPNGQQFRAEAEGQAALRGRGRKRLCRSAARSVESIRDLAAFYRVKDAFERPDAPLRAGEQQSHRGILRNGEVCFGDGQQRLLRHVVDDNSITVAVIDSRFSHDRQIADGQVIAAVVDDGDIGRICIVDDDLRIIVIRIRGSVVQLIHPLARLRVPVDRGHVFGEFCLTVAVGIGIHIARINLIAIISIVEQVNERVNLVLCRFGIIILRTIQLRPA